MSELPALLEADEVTRVFRAASGATIRAVDGVSLRVPRGAFLALTGPSGSGKTTLLSLLGALDRPTAGTVRFDAIDLARASEAERTRVRRRLGIVFQHAHMLPGLPLWENVTYPLVPRGVPTSARRRIGTELLARVGIPGREDARPEELSGGELQRVGLARALAAEPEVLLADEPTSELDEETAAVVRALFREFHAAGGTVVVATHDPALLALATQTFRLG